MVQRIFSELPLPAIHNPQSETSHPQVSFLDRGNLCIVDDGYVSPIRKLTGLIRRTDPSLFCKTGTDPAAELGDEEERHLVRLSAKLPAGGGPLKRVGR